MCFCSGLLMLFTEKLFRRNVVHPCFVKEADKIKGLLKSKLTALALGATLALTGCSFGSSVENLHSPPKLSEEQTEIYNALVSSVGSGIKLQYPKGGSYRSAFIIEDLDKEESKEAIVFYRNTNETNNGSIRVNILDKRNGKWQSVYDHAGIGTGIDRVMFANLGGSSRKSIIIGYNMLSNEKNMRVYYYEDGILYNTFSDNYSSMFTIDMNSDTYSELVVLHPNNEYTGKQAYVSLVTDDGSKVYESSSVLLNEKSSDFVNVDLGYIGSGTPAIYIDGISDGKLSTEIVYCINNTLRNPLYLSESEAYSDTIRPEGYICTDIDLDGVVEIPTISYFPGYSEDSRNSYIVTEWNVFNNYEIKRKYSSFYSTSEGFCFTLPSRWEGVVTVKPDTSTGDIVFYKFRADPLNSTEELLRIAVITSEYRDERLANGYTLYKTKDNINYMYKISDRKSEPLVLTKSEVTNNFYILA